jgi:Ca-activated chloride channel family protein
MILITDGEDHLGEAEKAAQAAKEKGIRIFTIGIGSEVGAPIPRRGGAGDFKKDRKGQLIMSKLHQATLQKIALTTGGSYVRSVSGDMDLKKIYEEEIRGKMEAGELRSTKKRHWEERFQWFLFGSILLFVLEAILPDRRRLPMEGPVRKHSPFWKRVFKVSLLSLALLCLAPQPSAAESVYTKMQRAEASYEQEAYDEALKDFLDAQVERPEDTPLKYNIGNTQYRMRNFSGAEEAFLGVASSGDPELQQRALYNLGNCAYRQGKLEDAVAYYKQALDQDPEDEDARFNLEYVREEIKRRLNEASKREKEEQQKQQEGETCQSPQAQQAPGDEKKEGSRVDRQELAEQQEEQEQMPSRTSDEDTAKQDQPGPSQEAETVRQMSPEEAERWLNTLDEEQREMARKQVEKALGGRTYRPQKDW